MAIRRGCSLRRGNFKVISRKLYILCLSLLLFQIVVMIFEPAKKELAPLLIFFFVVTFNLRLSEYL